jgi:hypothetical protein
LSVRPKEVFERLESGEQDKYVMRNNARSQ